MHSRCPPKTSPQDDQQLYRHFCISNDLLWRKIVNTNSLNRTQIQQKLAKIDPTFKPHCTIWALYISVTNQRKRDKYANEYHIHCFKWWANVLATDEYSIEISNDCRRKWKWMHSEEQ